MVAFLEMSDENKIGSGFRVQGMSPRASSELKRKLTSLAILTPQQSCEEFFD